MWNVFSWFVWGLLATLFALSCFILLYGIYKFFSTNPKRIFYVLCVILFLIGIGFLLDLTF